MSIPSVRELVNRLVDKVDTLCERIDSIDEKLREADEEEEYRPKRGKINPEEQMRIALETALREYYSDREESNKDLLDELEIMNYQLRAGRLVLNLPEDVDEDECLSDLIVVQRQLGPGE